MQNLVKKFDDIFCNRKREYAVISLLIFPAFLLRVLYLFQVRNNTFLNHPRLDALFHDTWALSILNGNFIGDDVFFRAPLYSYFLGLVYWIFGHDYFLVRGIQHVFGIMTVVFVYLIGKKWFDAKTGAIASLLTGINPMLIYFESQLLFESLLVMLISAWLFLITNAIEKQTQKRWFFTGFILGLLSITRPPVLIAGLFVVMIVRWKNTQGVPFSAALISLATFLAGLLLVILPVTVRNYVVGNEFVPIASQGGINFYIGNNPDADGISSSMPKRFGPSWENRNETYYVQQRIGHKPTAAEESAFWYNEAFQFIRENPVDFLALLLKKLYLFWNHVEIPNNLDFNDFRQFSMVLNFNPFGFWVLGPLALFGILITILKFGENEAKTIGLSFVGAFVLLTVVFFVCDRYRSPIIPILALFGSFGLCFLVDSIRQKEFERSIRFISAILFFSVLVNSDIYSIPATSKAREFFTHGILALEDRNNDSALENFQKAYAENPSYPNISYNLGLTEWIRGNTTIAMNWFHQELKLNPGSYNSCINLAIIYYGYGKIDSVQFYSQRAIHIKPYLPPGYVWLAKAKMATGQISEAESILVHASPLCGKNAFVYGTYLLAGIYSTQGRLLESEDLYRSVLSQLMSDKNRQPLYEPEFSYSYEQKIGEQVNILQAKCYFGLGYLYLARNLDTTAALFSAATKFDSTYADAYANLGITLLELKRIPEAESSLLRAIQLNPNNYLYWFNYGNILTYKKEYLSATKAFEKSFSLEPSFGLARERALLSNSLLQKKQY